MPYTVREMVRRGLPVYLGSDAHADAAETCAAFLPEGSVGRVMPLPAKKKTRVGGFLVQPFEVPHNVPNYGFLIESPGGERIVFVTDAKECRRRFRDIDCALVECNHDAETMAEDAFAGDAGRSHPENHLGLEECKAFCRANAGTRLKQVVLIHMSGHNVDAARAVGEISDALPGIRVSAARHGMSVTVENDDF